MENFLILHPRFARSATLRAEFSFDAIIFMHLPFRKKEKQALFYASFDHSDHSNSCFRIKYKQNLFLVILFLRKSACIQAIFYIKK